MQPRRRTALFGVALALGSAACGASSGADAPRATDAPLPVAAPAPDDLLTDGSDPARSTAPAVEPSDTATAEPPSDTTLAEVPASEPPATDTPAPILAEPVIGGRLFATDVQPNAQFDANPFPDLVVDDIGKDARVNIKNILPSDRPVLLWAWAPH